VKIFGTFDNNIYSFVFRTSPYNTLKPHYLLLPGQHVRGHGAEGAFSIEVKMSALAIDVVFE
jgi:hypothetical protein